MLFVIAVVMARVEYVTYVGGILGCITIGHEMCSIMRRSDYKEKIDTMGL